jgi:outer membrane receptor protein involved in Fe transport
MLSGSVGHPIHAGSARSRSRHRILAAQAIVCFSLAHPIFADERPESLAPVGNATAAPDTLPTRPVVSAPDSGRTSPDSAQAAGQDSIPPVAPIAADTVPASVRQLDKVTVTVKRPGAPKKAALDPVVVDLKSKRSAPVDLKSAIQTAPGLHLRQNGGAGSDFEININGLQGKAIKVFVDGVPQDARSAELALNSYSAEDLDRVELYKGVLPADLGADALGGGVNLVTRPIPGDDIGASYQTGSFGEQRLQGRAQKRIGEHVYVRADGTWGKADNDYPMTAQATNPVTRKVENRKVERFHDGFGMAAANGRVGGKDLPFVGNLEAGLRWTSEEKQYQHGATTRVTYGDVEGAFSELAPRLQWNRSWLDKRLQGGIRAEYTWNRSSFTDTSSLEYFWNAPPRQTTRTGGEINATNKALARLQTHTVSSRSGLRYDLSPSLAVSINHVWLGLERYGSDPFGVRVRGNRVDPLSIPSEYHRHYATLGLEGKTLGGSLGYELMAKSYAYFLEGPEGSNGYWSDGFTHRRNAYAGGAAALKWAPGAGWLLRGSYERALRFPDQDELMGDGTFTLPNYDLRPEHSHNFNLGAGWNNDAQGPGRLTADINLFARLQDDIILNLPAGDLEHTIHLNDEKARSAGVELGGTWNPWTGARLEANATYQDLRKLTAPDPDEKYLIDSRLPNVPYFFANMGAGQQFKSVLGAGDLVELTWSARFVNEFLLYPIPKESEGTFFWQTPDVKTEFIIPSQFIQNLGATYRIPGGRLSLGAEVRNLFDAAAYDNFRVPRPGRSVYAKVSAQY